MPTITVRQAQRFDLEQLCRLFVAFHAFHAQGVPDRLQSLGHPATFDCTELMASLTTVLGNTAAAVFVAEVAGQLIGLAEVYLRIDEESAMRLPCRYGYLQSLMVCTSPRVATCIWA